MTERGKKREKKIAKKNRGGRERGKYIVKKKVKERCGKLNRDIKK